KALSLRNENVTDHLPLDAQSQQSTQHVPMVKLAGAPLHPDGQKRQTEGLLLRGNPSGGNQAAGAFRPFISPVKVALKFPLLTDQGLDDRFLPRIKKGRAHRPAARRPVDPVESALDKGVLFGMKMVPDR